MSAATSLHDYLGTLVAYRSWHSERILEAASRVASADLEQASPSHGSIAQTLRHVLDVGYSWRRAAEGLPESDLMWETQDLMDLDTIRDAWREECRALEAFVVSLEPGELDGEVTPAWKDRPFRTWWIVSHIVHHQVEHGNELAWRLTDIGASPGELGLMGYLDTHR